MGGFDPRGKLISVVLVTISLVITSDLFLISVISLSMGLLLLRYRKFFRAIGGLKNWLFIAYFAFLVNTYFRGPMFGVAMALRLFALIIASQLFFLSSKQTEIVKSFRSLGLGEDYTIALSIALRFIPVIGEDSIIMADALRSKKVKYHFINKLRYSAALLAAIIGRTMYRVSAVAETLETRGFWEKISKDYKLRLKDISLILFSLLLLLLVIGEELGFYTMFGLLSVVFNY